MDNAPAVVELHPGPEPGAGDAVAYAGGGLRTVLEASLGRHGPFPDDVALAPGGEAFRQHDLYAREVTRRELSARLATVQRLWLVTDPGTSNTPRGSLRALKPMVHGDVCDERHHLVRHHRRDIPGTPALDGYANGGLPGPNGPTFPASRQQRYRYPFPPWHWSREWTGEDIHAKGIGHPLGHRRCRGRRLLAAACSSGSSSTSTANKGKTLKLGAVFSLTGAGGVYGPQQQNAVKLAVETINAAGGVDGATLSIQVVDDASTQTQSAQQTQTLIQQDQVVALLGPTLSNSAVAAHPIADNLKTPMLAVSTTGLNIVGSCPYPCTYIYRDSLGEATAIPTNIKTYVAGANPKPKTGVLLYPNDDKFSVDGATAVKQTVADPAVGIQLLDTIQFSKYDADLTQFVTQGVSSTPTSSSSPRSGVSRPRS